MSLIRRIFGGRESAAHGSRGRAAGVQRLCFRPHVRKGDGHANCSKFSGVALLQAGEEWPECDNCHRPMQLFLQLNSDQLPSEAGKPFGDGILQFFYCTSTEPVCEVDCQAFFPFSRSTLLRVIADRAGASRSESPVEEAFPPSVILGWQPLEDYPNWEELKNQGTDLTDAEIEELLDAGFPRAGDKLLGWPAWIQGIEYPSCPICRTRMRHLFQIDSECNLPYMFGDVGCGHVTQCPVHRDVLAFGWACS